MAKIGRPRLSLDDYQVRLAAYSARFHVESSTDGLPPFPSGKRETPQHRAWLSLYKLHRRLERRTHGQCERCAAPVVDGSVFCDDHRARGAPGAGVGSGADLAVRRRLHEAQGGRCPVCGAEVELQEAVDRNDGKGQLRYLLNRRCGQFVALAEALGPEAFDRTRQLLWPRIRSGRGRAAQN